MLTAPDRSKKRDIKVHIFTNLMEECSLQPLLVLLFDSHTVQSFPCISQKCVSVPMLVALVIVLGHLHVLLPEVSEFVRLQELQGALRGDCLDLQDDGTKYDDADDVDYSQNQTDKPCVLNQKLTS